MIYCNKRIKNKSTTTDLRNIYDEWAIWTVRCLNRLTYFLTPRYNRQTDPGCRSYDGGWLDGKMHGYGTYRFADGMTYEGVMRDNWPSGEGTARYSNGGMYVGGWKDGKYEVSVIRMFPLKF